MSRVLSLIALVLGCIALASSQSLKGSVAVADAKVTELADVTEAVKTESKVASVVAAEEAATLDELPPRHAPTTHQAIVAFVLIFLIPVLGIWFMMKGKDMGWEGAFGLICGLITLTWVYTAVNAL
eukprot:gb/GFBE01042634.1/.p1 GENE.gb/GFBE01042634.1/~~gb/GFBE01042634.1/.p1  ORF type:complete len:126 (+),score=35.24 gb/GFBE01042634.1/:1-378(+)